MAKHLGGWLVGLLITGAAQGAELTTWPDGRPVSLSPPPRSVQVVNVWATWCVPCRREMPLLSAWYRRQQQQRQERPVQMVGVALDSADNIARFVRQTPVCYPVWRYVGPDSGAWMKTLGNPVGALPFTLVRAPDCGFQQTLLGEIDAAKLDAAVAAARRQCLKT